MSDDRGFTSPGGTNQCHLFTAVDLKAHLLDRRVAARRGGGVAGIDALNFKFHCVAFPILLREPRMGSLVANNYNKPALFAAASRPL